MGNSYRSPEHKTSNLITTRTEEDLKQIIETGRLKGGRFKAPKSTIERAKRDLKALRKRKKEAKARRKRLEATEAYNCEEAEELRAARAALERVRGEFKDIINALPEMREDLKKAKKAWSRARAEYKYGDGNEEAMKKAEARRDELQEEVEEAEFAAEHFEEAIGAARRRVSRAEVEAREKAEELIRPLQKELAPLLQQAMEVQRQIEARVRECKHAGLLSQKEAQAAFGWYRLKQNSGSCKEAIARLQ